MNGTQTNKKKLQQQKQQAIIFDFSLLPFSLRSFPLLYLHSAECRVSGHGVCCMELWIECVCASIRNKFTLKCCENIEKSFKLWFICENEQTKFLPDTHTHTFYASFHFVCWRCVNNKLVFRIVFFLPSHFNDFYVRRLMLSLSLALSLVSPSYRDDISAMR